MIAMDDDTRETEAAYHDNLFMTAQYAEGYCKIISVLKKQFAL